MSALEKKADVPPFDLASTGSAPAHPDRKTSVFDFNFLSPISKKYGLTEDYGSWGPQLARRRSMRNVLRAGPVTVVIDDEDTTSHEPRV